MIQQKCFLEQLRWYFEPCRPSSSSLVPFAPPLEIDFSTTSRPVRFLVFPVFPVPLSTPIVPFSIPLKRPLKRLAAAIPLAFEKTAYVWLEERRKRSGLGICSCCDQPEFIMCSYCEQLLCFHHFWHGLKGFGHWCVMEHVHWIELNLFICCLILFCSAKSSKTILGFLTDIQMGNFNLRAKTKFSCSTIKIKIVEKWHLRNLFFNFLS